MEDGRRHPVRRTDRRGRARWLVALLAALAGAYVAGRAVGILLGVGPYPTQAIAMLLVIAFAVRAALRRGSTGGWCGGPPAD